MVRSWVIFSKEGSKYHKLRLTCNFFFTFQYNSILIFVRKDHNIFPFYHNIQVEFVFLYKTNLQTMHIKIINNHFISRRLDLVLSWKKFLILAKYHFFCLHKKLIGPRSCQYISRRLILQNQPLLSWMDH